MRHTTRRWSGLSEIVDRDGNEHTSIRVHIAQSKEVGVSDGQGSEASWEGALLTASAEDLGDELAAQLVGLCTLRLANGKTAEIVVRVDGSFAGVGPCPVDMF